MVTACFDTTSKIKLSCMNVLESRVNLVTLKADTVAVFSAPHTRLVQSAADFRICAADRRPAAHICAAVVRL
jgi:hypothetical protein